MHDDTDPGSAYTGAYDAAFGAALRAAVGRLRLGGGARRTIATLVAAFALVAGAVGMAGPAQAAGATLSGTILGPGGAPAANLGVLVYGATTTVTDAAGHFSVPVTPGNWYAVCWGSDYAHGVGDDHYLSGCYGYVVAGSGDTQVPVQHVRLGGVLTGHVTGPSGPLNRAWVSIYKRVGGGVDDFARVNSTRTDGSGSYRLTLIPGTYRVEFRSSGLVTGYYENASTLLTATDVSVGRGDTVTADGALVQHAGISGHVTGSASAGGHVDGYRTVAVFDVATGKIVRHANIARDGAYHVWNLPTGTYKVAFNRLSGFADDAAEFWNEKAESLTLAGADAIALSSGQARTGIDAQLDHGGYLTGTITDGSGNPLNRCLVQAYTRDGHLVTRLGMSHHGDFLIGGLTSGQYYVRVLSPRNTNGECDGGRQWLASPTGGVLAQDFTGATPVTITQGVTKTLGNPLVYQRGAVITGTVALPAGNPTHIDRTVVVRNKLTNKVVGHARVAADGSYTVHGIQLGTYRVTFARVSGMAQSAAEFFDDVAEGSGAGNADTVSITTVGEQHGGVDATLVDGGVIHGILVGSSGTPLEGCYLQAYTADHSLVTRTAYSQPDGTFDIAGLATGSYRLRLIGARHSACRGATLFYAGAPDLVPTAASATPIAAQVGQTTTLSGNLVFATGGSISGVVTRPSGSSRYLDRDVVVRNTVTGAAHRTRLHADGSYAVTGLPAGTYRVTFNRVSGFAFSAAQFFDAKAESAGAAAATTVTIAAGDANTGVDATLVEGGHITGRLVDTDGTPLPCAVQAYTPDHHLVTRISWVDTDGSFDISGLSTGSYLVRVVPDNYLCASGRQYVASSQGGTLATSHTAAVPVLVTQGQTRHLASNLVYNDNLPPVVNKVAPTVSGSTVVGNVLTTLEGSWGPNTITFSYQWLANGAPIGGATGRTYGLTAAEQGKSISVRVTGSRNGYSATTRTSAAVGPVSAAGGNQPPPAPHAFTLVHKPGFKGKAVVGQKLKADAGRTTPTATTVHYQWLLNGKVIKKATKSSYLLTKHDAGKKISLQVTYVSDGYTTLVVTSAAKKVKGAKR